MRPSARDFAVLNKDSEIRDCDYAPHARSKIFCRVGERILCFSLKKSFFKTVSRIPCHDDRQQIICGSNDKFHVFRNPKLRRKFHDGAFIVQHLLLNIWFSQNIVPLLIFCVFRLLVWRKALKIAASTTMFCWLSLILKLVLRIEYSVARFLRFVVHTKLSHDASNNYNSKIKSEQTFRNISPKYRAKYAPKFSAKHVAA